jgi:hypothetical protein
MKEWATVPLRHARQWQTLASEALQYARAEKRPSLRSKQYRRA